VLIPGQPNPLCRKRAYRTLPSSGPFRLSGFLTHSLSCKPESTTQQPCVSKPLTSNGLFRHNIVKLQCCLTLTTYIFHCVSPNNIMYIMTLVMKEKFCTVNFLSHLWPHSSLVSHTFSKHSTFLYSELATTRLVMCPSYVAV
jgi:hypothetical protein